MSLGALLRDLRKAKNLSQPELAALINQGMKSPKTREDISRWENDRVIPGPTSRKILSRVLKVPVATLDEQASLDRVKRREFLSLTALTAVHGPMATEMAASIAGNDTGPLTTLQTTHGTDLVIASLIDRPSMPKLRRWMTNGDDPVLRVNAAGILAKVPDRDTTAEVVQVLAGDSETRLLYATAVLFRSCALEWETAARLAAEPMSMPDKATFFASRLATEVLNPRDVGARWCAAEMLRHLSPLLG